SVVARREGFLSLEGYMTASKDPFIGKGLRLVIDGVDPGRLLTPKAILAPSPISISAGAAPTAPPSGRAS
ncbi:MAG: hypothetical protein AAGU05_17450, partial [Anaerolineaceae bacterium]